MLGDRLEGRQNGPVRSRFSIPLVIWLAGVACFGIGALAATTHVSRHDLYVDIDGSVCNGGSILATCYSLDPAAFHPPPPDITAYEPRGFGYVEPAAVPGGRLYFGRCEVQAIEVNGTVSSRPEFGLWSALSNFSWGLPLGMVLMITAGALYISRRDTPLRVKRTARAAVTAEAALAALYMLVVFVSWSASLAVTTSTAVVILFTLFAMVALSGYAFAIGLTVQLAVQRAPRQEIRSSIDQLGGGFVFLFGLVAVSFLNILTLWC